MAADLAGSAQVFLDTCCVLNLYATGRMGEILSVLPERFAVADAVLRESLYVRDLPSQEDWQAVDLTKIIASELLMTASPDSEEEMSLLVSFAEHLGDGEAATCALAVSRGGSMATDDRKAIRLLGSLEPPVRVMTTPFLLERWCSLQAFSRQEIRKALQDVERRASFRPRASDPLCAWWKMIVGWA
ncbi:MAG TPA: hypothetical protein VLX28_04875 [Thermoanaerobaculia bacterium]|nr:hypothetical protein [Thermoanaerobaculia bacterium]